MGLESLFNYLPLVPERVQEAAVQAVKKAAFDIQAIAALNAPVDTGFLKSSIYVVTHDASTYSQGALDPPQGAELLPEIDHPSSKTIAYVAVGASYGIYQEFGTVYQPAQPYLGPAAEVVKGELETVVKAMMDKFVVF